jgi:hypothetical protein
MEKVINNTLYMNKMLDAMTQLQLARRLVSLTVLIEAMTKPENKDKDQTLLITMMLGQLSDADHSFVMTTCMKSVFRRDGDNWAKVMTDAGALMYADIDLDTLINLVAAVIVENLGDFFRTALAKMPQAGAAAPIQLSQA